MLARVLFPVFLCGFLSLRAGISGVRSHGQLSILHARPNAHGQRSLRNTGVVPVPALRGIPNLAHPPTPCMEPQQGVAPFFQVSSKERVRRLRRHPRGTQLRCYRSIFVPREKRNFERKMPLKHPTRRRIRAHLSEMTYGLSSSPNADVSSCAPRDCYFQVVSVIASDGRRRRFLWTLER